MYFEVDKDIGRNTLNIFYFSDFSPERMTGILVGIIYIFLISDRGPGRMAGIIAQLTRAARERSNKRTYGTNKCMWV